LSAYYLWFRVIRCNYTLFLRHTFQALRNENILFTKIFQALANSANLTLTPECRTELQPFTTQVSYTNDEIDDAAIDEAEATYNIVVDRRVINAGMIALVFRGTRRTEDGDQPIILKLKRRGITAHLQRGCNDVGVIYRYIYYWFPKNIYVRILGPFIRNLSDIIEQCDFDHEIQNLREAKTDLVELPYIKIPTCYNNPGQNNKYILMEYIDGTHTLPNDTPLSKRLAYLEQFCNFNNFCFLSNAMQHIDLHAGNILFLPDGLGVIDYGMAFRPSEEMHEIALTSADVILHPGRINEIDIIDRTRNLFVPPLSVETMQNVPLVREILQSIARPLRQRVTLDELSLTDNLNRLSTVLNQEIIINRDLYKMILGMTMMGFMRTVMGPEHFTDELITEYAGKATERMYAKIMLS